MSLFILAFLLYATCLSAQADAAEGASESGFYYSKHFEDKLPLARFVKVIPESEAPSTLEEIVLLPDSATLCLSSGFR